MNDHLILLRTYRQQTGGYTRSIGDFRCPNCSLEFSARMERLKVMTGLCTPCANKKAGETRRTHGLNNTNSRLHVTWSNMKRRCLNPQGDEVVKYAGITICAEWMKFEPFMEWSMANGYTEEMTIDRIDTNGGYEPGNCRYADHSVQAANRRLTDKNKSGHVGVSFYKGRWCSRVQWRKKQINLGRFVDINDAIKARNDYLDKHNLPHLRA